MRKQDDELRKILLKLAFQVIKFDGNSYSNDRSSYSDFVVSHADLSDSDIRQAFKYLDW